MNQLEDKYINGTLKVSELDALRQQLQNEHDETIAGRMQQRWEHDEVDPSVATPSDMDTIWSRIRNHITSPADYPASRRHAVWLWIQRAAVVLLPLLLVSLFYLYRENRSLSASITTVSTGKGEHATVTLPDSTRVVLNGQTVLSYQAQSFNTRQRQVSFNGEGWFEVARDTRHPFLIETDRTSVTVTGTKFNLQARPADTTTTLTLAEGSVTLTHRPTGRHMLLHSGQKAVLNKETGAIRVADVSPSLKEETAWQRQEIVFRNTPLRAVINSLEQNFDMTLHIEGGLNLDDLYTGTMSITDLNVDLEILERLYHVKTRVEGQQVFIHADIRRP